MYQCRRCGRPADLVTGCPHCGEPAPPLAAELERLNRDIAEMSARDLSIQKERANLSQKMQAALHQRALLQDAQAQRIRRPPRQRSTARRVTTLLPPRPTSSEVVDDGPVDGAARGPARGAAVDVPRPPRPAPTARIAPPAEHEGPRPEASSRSVQNVLLGLGGLLLGVAALTFTVAVLTTLGDVGRAAILTVVCAIVLMVPPFVARRGLTATAETVTIVGLILVPLAGHAFWQIDAVREILPVSATGYAGLVCLGVAVISLAYEYATGLTAPRYAALLAVQPVVPLLGFDRIVGPAGWALVLIGIAAADAAIGRALERPEARLAPAAAEGVTPSAPAAAPAQRRAPRAAALASYGWLRELTWVLHGLAVGAGLVYAGVALATASDVGAALRAAITLLLAAAVGLAGALSLRRWPLPDLASGIMTLAIISSAARVAAVALPGRALLLISAAVALTGAGVRVLPPFARRGPQLAASGALAVLGIVVAGAGLRAASAPVRAVLPPWEADLSRYGGLLRDAVGPAGWQLAISAALLTIAAALAVPHQFRREATVAGAAVTALATPAAFGLDWSAAPWVLFVAAVALGITGLSARTVRGARTHVAAALLVGLVAAASSLATTGLTAAVLSALTVAGVVLGVAPRFVGGGPYADVTAEAAQGAAAAALPGAVASTIAAAMPVPAAVPMLAGGLIAVSVSLWYAALAQVALRRPARPAALGGTVAALTVAIAAIAATGATTVDTLVAVLLLAGALLLWLAPAIDAGRRADRMVDGADIAAAAVTAGAIGALTRVAALVMPGSGLVTTAVLVLVVALGIWLMPAHWRPGPALGCGVAGSVIAAFAGYAAIAGGLRVLIAASPIWSADLDSWRATVSVARGYGAQTPVALILLAAAAAVILPLRARAIVVPAGVALAVIGAPAALGLPWWSPVALSLAVATVLGLAAAGTDEPQTGTGRAAAAALLAGFAVGASLVQPWATASALAGVAVAAIMVAATARVSATLAAQTAPPLATRLASRSRPVPAVSGAPAVVPRHLVPVGGTAVTSALLALPGALAAAAASLSHSPDVVLTAALAATAVGLATVALMRRWAGDYLSYAAVGTAMAATATAFAALAVGEPYGVYAAAAALLGVLTELLRTSLPRPGQGRVRAPGEGGRLWRTSGSLRPRLIGRGQSRSTGVLTPGLLGAAGVPTLLALASIAPALTAVLVEPHRTLQSIWTGPDGAGVNWTAGASGASVIAALVLTLATGLAAVGFGERVTAGGGPGRLTRDELLAQVVPVVIPGIAVTLLIAPAGLGFGWPVGTVAALLVFTIAMLGVALSPPPPRTEAGRSVRVTRWLVLVIGLAAGGAGLAGSLATRSLTLGTLAGAVAVGLTAALGGRTHVARILGWAFAAASAHALAFVAGLAVGLPPHWSAFGVLGMAALCLVTAATLPRLRRPLARGEGATLEWSGYAGALFAMALAVRSLPHLAALLAAWGAVLGIAAVRPGRPTGQRRILLWAAMLFELAAWWLLMNIAEVAVIEVYTLAFAALALLVGVVELRHHPELGSWAAYGPALVAAFVPTLAIVLVTDAAPARRILLVLGAVAVLIIGSISRQRAPVVVGGVVTTIAAIHELIAVSEWFIFIPIGVLLVALGATYEKRRRDLQRLRGALNRMR